LKADLEELGVGKNKAGEKPAAASSAGETPQPPIGGVKHQIISVSQYGLAPGPQAIFDRQAKAVLVRTGGGTPPLPVQGVAETGEARSEEVVAGKYGTKNTEAVLARQAGVEKKRQQRARRQPHLVGK